MTFHARVLGVAAGWALATALAAAPSSADPPEVLKVEPPSWWVGHSLDPVRLLVRGRALHGARVEAGRRDLRVASVRVNEAGTYAFVDVHVPKGAAAGAAPLRLSTPGGQANVPFELHPEPRRSGRFRGFSSDDVIYLAMPDRFANGDRRNDDPSGAPGLFDRRKPRHYHGGDLQGVLDRLPYLEELGVTALWLNPIYENSNLLNHRQAVDGQPITDYHGYHATDLYAVEDRFGDMALLQRLVAEAQRHGLKVIQDQVANHVGPEHPWAADPPTPTWFNGTPERHLENRWQIWTLMDPHATPEVRQATLDGWFVNVLPDLNQDDPEVARYLIQNSLWWVGVLGLDGIRQDTLPYVPRRFWRDWMAALKREHPGLRVVGEMWDGDPSLVSFFQGGHARWDGIDSGIDALFDFPLYYPMRRAFAEGKSLREVAVALAHDHLYEDPASLVTFLGLHDVKRFMSEPGATLDGLKLAFSFQMTARGIPLVYYGDEIAMAGGDDPDNRRDFPGGWPDDPRSAFEASGRTPEQQSVFEHLRRLLKLRAELPALRRGALLNLMVAEQTWAFARVAEASSVVAVFNNGPSEATIECAAGPARLAEGAVLEDRLGASAPVRVESGRLRVTLPPRSAGLLVTPPLARLARGNPSQRGSSGRAR